MQFILPILASALVFYVEARHKAVPKKHTGAAPKHVNNTDQIRRELLKNLEAHMASKEPRPVTQEDLDRLTTKPGWTIKSARQSGQSKHH